MRYYKVIKFTDIQIYDDVYSNNGEDGNNLLSYFCEPLDTAINQGYRIISVTRDRNNYTIFLEKTKMEHCLNT